MRGLYINSFRPEIVVGVIDVTKSSKNFKNKLLGFWMKRLSAKNVEFKNDQQTQ